MKYDLYLESFRSFIEDCPEEDLDGSVPYVFFSDLHMGDGSGRDDLAPNRRLIEHVLEHWYLPRGYLLVLNGDVEDLNKFRLADIRTAWPHLLSIFSRFAELGRLRKIVGNHDYELLAERAYPWKLYPGIVYRRGEDRIFVFHGHQASSLYVKYDYVSEFLVRYLVKPLHIRNSGVSKDSRRRFRTEKIIYRAARSLGVVAITGHTHRPLFESLSKYDNLRVSLEGILRRYVDADYGQKDALEAQIKLYRDEMRKLSTASEKSKKTQSLYGSDPFLIPCIFNSGCATGKHGITSLEIQDGKIALVYWTGANLSRPYISAEAIDTDTDPEGIARHTLHRERLDSVFTRIRFLGESANL